ncbi:unnamed protein product [Pedinophyceae sp. YPF-701]|nr:unnamed protein product [Pedinophyceae sp. YPF-701]
MSTAICQSERDETVRRLAESLYSIAFFREGQKIVSEDVARDLAATIEKKAYAAAEVSSSTTTGERPKHEVVSLYSKKVGQLVVEAITQGASLPAASGAAGVQVSAAGEILDLSQGEREFYDAAGARAALAPLLTPHTNITSVCFSTKSFGAEAAAVAKEALHNARASLVDANLSDVIAGRPEAEALNTLAAMAEGLAECRLRSVNLSDNALGEKGIRRVADVFTKQEALEAITLENVGLSVYACRALDELVGPRAQSLKKIHLHNNMSGDEGAEAIGNLLSRAPHMQDFKMVYCRVGGAGGIALSKGLAAGSSLTHVDLHGNPMGPSMAPALASALSHQQDLRVLRLQDTLLEDEGVAHVCRSLARTAPYLEELDLSLNEITAGGSQAVAMCLMGKPSLLRLILRENELGDKGTAQVCRALKSNETLKVLDLSENQIRGPGAEDAAALVAGRAGFERLELDGNWIEDEVVAKVRAVLAAGASGDVLGSMDENDADMADDDEDADELAEGMAKMGV